MTGQLILVVAVGLAIGLPAAAAAAHPRTEGSACGRPTIVAKSDGTTLGTSGNDVMLGAAGYDTIAGSVPADDGSTLHRTASSASPRSTGCSGSGRPTAPVARGSK